MISSGRARLWLQPPSLFAQPKHPLHLYLVTSWGARLQDNQEIPPMGEKFNRLKLRAEWARELLPLIQRTSPSQRPQAIPDNSCAGVKRKRGLKDDDVASPQRQEANHNDPIPDSRPRDEDDDAVSLEQPKRKKRKCSRGISPRSGDNDGTASRVQPGKEKQEANHNGSDPDSQLANKDENMPCLKDQREQ
ncbi:hypothetical protein AAL_02400 [Moelleriella libera RCEF 2490]|uniref:Uncharacterized protein n=1 Tax=Moelleriella libera RCEF 2490 TaxID=1081109 RepID=A0A168EJ25_9HYPO|nr:hypothetical protein AAL_02400 [Moelleriella libera RCEF 2490]